MRKKTLLTEVELEMMNQLWRLGEAGVADVQNALLPSRKLAYTSVSTMLRILETKGIVGSRKEGRGHLYFPKLDKAKYEATALDFVVEKVFDGAPSSLVRRLVDHDSLSKEDLRELQKLLEERLKKE